MLRIAAVNQDRGISPGRQKGAAVHLAAMRGTFAGLGADVEAFDIPDDRVLASALEKGHRLQPFGMVYERYALGKSTAARFARQEGIPLVLEVNSPLAREQKIFRRQAESVRERRHDLFLFSGASCVVAVSGAVADYAVERGAPRERVKVCPNGVDTERFNLNIDGSGFRSEFIPDGKFVMGFHGRLRPWHRFDCLAAVFRKLLARGLPVHLLVVGEGRFDELEKLPPQDFTRLGWQPHERMPGLVAAFDALPLTYRPDLPCYFSPLKLMEAMACGVVPLVPQLGDLPLIVEHGRTGLVYPAGDMESLETHLAMLAGNPGARRRLGLGAGRQAAKSSWRRIAEDILETVFELRARAGSGNR